MQGEEIPLVARIVAVADVFDALLSDRPYRKGMEMVDACDSIVASSGSHFDPMVVAAMLKAVNKRGMKTTKSL